MSAPDPPRLERRLGLGGAVSIGLAAMLGTGVFAAWTPALALAGPLVLVSLLVAGAVAALNAWSTAALAREMPEAGGAYAYGRALLGRPAGVVAGVAFVVGKIASAGAAALVVGAYAWPEQQRSVALLAVVAVLALDLRGVTRTAAASAISAALVLVVLLVLVVTSWSYDAPVDPVVQPTAPGVLGVLGAAGLLFVAFAGYARIATLGEEVREPRRTLPRAVALALATVLTCYVVVGVEVLRVLGPLPVAVRGATPLEQLASITAGSAVVGAVRVAAVIAAGGALLSLVAGVGRTLFAMARGGDAPAALAGVSSYGVPHRAQVVAAVGAALVAAVGGIGPALALSGVSVLAYYGVAHLAALRLEDGRPPRAVMVLGLLGCVVVASSLVLLAGNTA